MSENNSRPAGLPGLVRKLAVTGMAAAQNRGELFLVELQEEKIRLFELWIWTAIATVLGLMFLLVGTVTAILLFPGEWRFTVALGFCFLYLLGTVLALLNLHSLWKDAPPAFRDTLAEARKDLEWLDSSK
jgi:uncharacterized membrane protein YqjE